MAINFLWEAVILLSANLLLLRLAGKKSVAQMTILEIIVILAIGTTMGHAIKENELWQVITVTAVFILFLIVCQKLQLKSRLLEKYMIGTATLVIQDGTVLEQSLKKLRITQSQLEMRLRQKGISYISDVKVATIESDGGLGYELMPHAAPVTKEELLAILDKRPGQEDKSEKTDENIFNQVIKNNR
ncbi:DUF421 domain-containing protein [Paenibacillus hamazuiensis]|uniref:DUF421 domain-containing protein n=1 Tax=Paenibacillus hamazuiensis TaxID=2936508 RepID=UPI00200D4B72|nr:YetF domain-containing protein [Paenibacillus hamazuiensis]